MSSCFRVLPVMKWKYYFVQYHWNIVRQLHFSYPPLSCGLSPVISQWFFHIKFRSCTFQAIFSISQNLEFFLHISWSHNIRSFSNWHGFFKEAYFKNISCISRRGTSKHKFKYQFLFKARFLDNISDKSRHHFLWIFKIERTIFHFSFNRYY